MAAVVFSDAVGFSARMAVDENRTLRLVERDLTLMTEICQRQGGQVLKSTGDGLLMYFEQAISAVACALEIQQQLVEQRKTLSDPDILEHRIGIHVGNVYLKDNDIMGNGVNIAARLQTQAEPNGICISKSVYDDVKKTLSVKATYLGLRELKNISDAFPVYQILLESGDRPKRQPSPTVPLRQDYRNRQVLLEKVHQIWIKGGLERSLQGRVLLDLGLASREDLLDRPWGMTWQQESHSEPLPSGTQALDKFDELGVGRTLLILGEPGSGKTTTLLEMARELIERARYDVSLPIPVLFNLSSWRGKRQTIADWLVAELKHKYQVRQQTASTWIQEQKLLLLLDGLDEVQSNRREACVAAINEFYQDHGQTELIVCSRVQDYEALNTRLQLQGAICLQPLTSEQVSDYFQGTGDALAGVAQVMDEDTHLREFGRSPLMLSIMSLAYQGMSASELQETVTPEQRRQHLFDTYIQRMLNRHVGPKPYSDQQTQHWLSYLAKQLVRESQTIFLIEGIQLNWLQTKQQILEYNLKLSVILGAVLGAILWTFFPYVITTSLEEFPLFLILLFGGIIVGGVSAVCWTELQTVLGQKLLKPIGALGFSLLVGLIVLMLGWLFGLIYSSVAGMDSVLTQPVNVPVLYLSYVGLGLLFWSVLKNPIIPANQLQWSSFAGKKSLAKGMWWGLGFGLVFGGIAVFNALSNNFELSGESLHNSLFTLLLAPILFGIPLGIMSQLVGGLIAFLIGGFTGIGIDKTTWPNQGIWQALYNASILGGIVIVLLGTLFGLLGGPIPVAIAIGVAVALLSGGLTALKHGLLRSMLRSHQLIPRNDAHFLDYATTCIFLQKMGGGYIFIHRFLLEHFAAMP
ncbi:NACHT domain-containing protein [Phormidium yuhuli AB48]|uniref:NACHT domain-containing protein n=1 Tax=Phormidium yuhuli AB48 TaxID=2940671 RepID=A0ABY5APR8_9CYAN|nr:NACHT domain-containing protein [Phormidium yuhuli]USR91204.1 NACHT domain-containing protein [Phormidium yuhuli AB48]